MQPIFVLPSDSTRTSGKEAQRSNIQAAKVVADAVRTTLGPKGMDKMLVDQAGSVTVTNDGVTILEEMMVDHPCAKMIVEVAKTQEAAIGDGTTTAVVLAGELLQQAEQLLEQGVHPTVIARGYRTAAEKTQEILTNVAGSVTLENTHVLQNLAMTAMTGKGVEDAREHLANIVVQAAQRVATQETQSGTLMEVHTMSRNDVHTIAKPDGKIADTMLVEGLVLEQQPLIPVTVTTPKIALLNTALEIQNTEVDARINISEPSQLQAFLEMEEQMLRKMVDSIKESGATVVCNQKGIDDVAATFLANEGIMALRRVPKTTMDRIATATNASIISNLDSLTTESLGMTSSVTSKTVGNDSFLFMEGCPAVTIVVRGSTEHVLAEVHRALEDAIGDVASALSSGKVVAGAGSPEAHAATELRTYARTLSGREQLAVMQFADALEIIPRTLAENAGMDPVDTIADLRTAHGKNDKYTGVDVFSRRTMDARKEGVLEPLSVKTQAITSATEVAMMILRIDDVIAAGKDGNV